MIGRLGRWLVLAVGAVYFFGPFLVTIWFTLKKGVGGGLTLAYYREIWTLGTQGGVSFQAALLFSVGLALATIVFTLGLMVPTQLLLRLSAARMRPLIEGLCLLPLVFPPVVYVVGITNIFGAVAPTEGHGSPLFHVLAWIRTQTHPALLVLVYAVMTLPYVYRTLDAGLRSFDVSTLTEASRNLGAGWTTTILRVVVPSMRTSIVNSAFLIFALVMGEFTISSILLYTKPLAIWLVQLPSDSGQVQAAVSVLSLLIVEVVLVLSSGVLSRSRSEKKVTA